jgi:hypothetical protein
VRGAELDYSPIGPSERTGPIPDLDQARQVLEDFTTFWRDETEPQAKREFLSLIFEGVWLAARRVVAVQPKSSFLPFFTKSPHKTPAKGMCKVRERRGSRPRLAPG